MTYLPNPLTTQGDIIAATTGGVQTRVPVGGANTIVHGGTTPAYSAVVENDIMLTDNTTNNVSTSKHGFMQKLPGDTVTFYRADGTFAASFGDTTSIASSATPTPNSDTTTYYTITALAAGATFGAPTGSPVNGQRLFIRIKDNGTARTLAWNAAYRAIGIVLPTTTVISKTLYVGCVYNSTDSKWDVLAVAQEV